MRQIIATLGFITLLALGGCKEPLLEEIQVPECPGLYKPVKVVNGSISGEYLDNLLDNVLEDRLCIARLKALLGDKKIKKLLKALPKDERQQIEAKLNNNL